MTHSSFLILVLKVTSPRTPSAPNKPILFISLVLNSIFPKNRFYPIKKRLFLFSLHLPFVNHHKSKPTVSHLLHICISFPIKSTQGKMSKTQRTLTSEQRNYLETSKMCFSEHLFKVYHMPSTVSNVVGERWVRGEAHILSECSQCARLAPSQPRRKGEGQGQRKENEGIDYKVGQESQFVNFIQYLWT